MDNKLALDNNKHDEHEQATGEAAHVFEVIINDGLQDQNPRHISSGH